MDSLYTVALREEPFPTESSTSSKNGSREFRCDTITKIDTTHSTDNTNIPLEGTDDDRVPDSVETIDNTQSINEINTTTDSNIDNKDSDNSSISENNNNNNNKGPI